MRRGNFAPSRVESRGYTNNGAGGFKPIGSGWIYGGKLTRTMCVLSGRSADCSERGTRDLIS